MTVKRKEVFFFDGKTAECVLASDYDALRQENERLVAANKARAEYLTTRRAGNDVDSYVNLAEAEIAALRLQLTDALNRQTCEGGQPYICHALATARSRLSDIESQNRMMWDVANDREARLAEAVKDNERLHAVAGRLIAVIRNVHGHLLDDRIDAALLGATDSATNRENERE